MLSLKNFALSFFILTPLIVFSQQKQVIPTNKVTWNVFEDKEQTMTWTITPEAKPDVMEIYMTGKSKLITFANGTDSIRFVATPGKTLSFVFLLNGKDSAFTEIKGIKEIPNARFSNQYIKTHRGKTFVEIPPVYELVNIAFALTKYGKEDKGLVVRNTSYYKELLDWFDKYSNEPAINELNKVLTKSGDSYFPLKMDAYAFELSKNDRITQSAVYDRASWGKTNQLRPYIPGLQDFADKSNFVAFFKKHESFYNSQIVAYRDSIGVPEMQKWLTTNFPSTKYDSFKIIFSPLVGYNQSAHWLEDNGFREAHAHVNFPYRSKGKDSTTSKKALLVKDGNIVFSELNHSFINPEADKPQYAADIRKAFANLATWNEKGKPAAQSYNDAYSCFNEHMNWGLVSLRYVDNAPQAEQQRLISAMEKSLVEYRGFKKFDQFNQFLVQLYKSRKNGQTVADLYPDIVKWFVDHRD